VGADLEGLFVCGEGAGGGVLFLRRAAPAFVEGLHPEGFGSVGHGFGKSVQSGRAGVQSSRESLPPGIEQGVDGVRGARAELLADSFDGGALAGAQEGVGGTLDVAGRDAARSLAIAVRGCGHSLIVSTCTAYIWDIISHHQYSDNDSYHMSNMI
jgi:hypothetical protein